MAENTTTRKKKFKKLRKIKGFITGKSKRSNRSEAAIPAAETTSPEPFSNPPTLAADDETQYGADFDNQSVASSSVVTSTDDVGSSADTITIIVLLMDPETRRFELIQLEFDNSAKVNNILSQIFISATEPSLKSQKYEGICDQLGSKMDEEKMLSDYVTKAAVVIAVPEFPDGVNAIESAMKMSKPILTNPKVINMLEKSGLDFTVLSPKSAPLEPVQDEIPYSEPSSPEPAKPTAVEEEEKSEVKPQAEVNKESFSFFSLALMLAVIAHFLMKVESNITSPLGPGDSLAPGQWKSKCGMVGLLPMSNCSPAAVEMGKDGIFKVYDGEEVVFSLTGATCSGKEDDCVDDLIVEEDGTVLIGGRTVKAPSKSSIPLHPWPFTENVVVSCGWGKWF